ncbi:cytosolic 10-formyltetrahydrofolate dehydrogenase isoform X1 [Lepeophtheirus salmonis]|uniref:cytosolic 10-formyltetrahydrofolate dehydrogenase isoform X1 n=2 Tax=Lepeophtheirus salmonis TaxID=72036 RepID=UPI001AE54F20|nr:cytosolic 10-formyltetrahydrofolate dehydrogenase-like isoform X1 [Lepeophtheirus salmonis]
MVWQQLLSHSTCYFTWIRNMSMRIPPIRVAIIGQSSFAVEVFKGIKNNGHEIVGVFTVPDDKNGREDPVAIHASSEGVPVFKFKAWRKKATGETIPSVLKGYTSIKADLNVMPYCSQFIPMNIIQYPKYQSICYHPSILPKHRGASAIGWTLIDGDKKAGFSIFYPDDGLDTGPILLQRSTPVYDNDTIDSLYNNFMYPEGIRGMVEAVNLIASGCAPCIPQTEEGATYDPQLNKPETTRIPIDSSAREIHNFIRGCDSVPGAWTLIDGKETKLFGSQLWRRKKRPDPLGVVTLSNNKEGIAHEDGLLISGSDGKCVNVKMASRAGKFIKANQLFETRDGDVEEEVFVFTPDEEAFFPELKSIWTSIIKKDVTDDTDFFDAGAGSMDVVRLIEEIKDTMGVSMTNEDVFMATTFKDFKKTLAISKRGGGQTKPLVFTPHQININKMEVSFPTQLFINGEFVDSIDNTELSPTYNPHDGSVICHFVNGSKRDVDKAVKAAHTAFYEGEWSKMSARERGQLLFKLADLMEEHKEELATIESIDSGAVYTLALKTHIGMSIDTWRYFAGWTDKIQGSTIPTSASRPNFVTTFTVKEPVGVCGLVTPWNYPLMMLSWKMAACLAAGNTVVIKPAFVCPLTALKFAELSHKAGIPPGVINIVTGDGRITGQALADHPLVRKLGFTGSTAIGHVIMKSAAESNLKKVSLELGGKSPLIIFADCDLDKAVKQAMGGVFFNKGENCIAAGRIFVEASIYDAFLEKVIKETKKIKIGDPLDRSTSHGPQNHEAHMKKLLEYCERGINEGARLLLGGKKFEGIPNGLYMEPTIFADVEDDMYIADEESFGPIMIVSKFDPGNIDEVISRANDTEYGLASGVFTEDINKALYVSRLIEAGTCFINTYNKTDVAAPFGGFKRSGFGKDLGQEALNEYLKTKTVTIEHGKEGSKGF